MVGTITLYRGILLHRLFCLLKVLFEFIILNLHLLLHTSDMLKVLLFDLLADLPVIYYLLLLLLCH